jgi:hypothetical protein
MLGAAACAIANGDTLVIETAPVAIYATDIYGRIIWFNRACVDLAGRVPDAGRDHWCISWRLYGADGVPMPHDESAMATALHHGRPVRDVEAICERPDGSRVPFLSYATPIFDGEGRLKGGVNLLLDRTREHEAAALREQAARCMRLAGTLGDRTTVDSLQAMADEFESRAVALEQDSDQGRPS